MQFVLVLHGEVKRLPLGGSLLLLAGDLYDWEAADGLERVRNPEGGLTEIEVGSNLFLLT